MHPETRIIIRKRAEAIGKLAALQLEFDDDLAAVEAFKYSYLALRAPKAYLSQFQGGDLRINIRQVDTFLWRNQERLFGVGRCSLLPEEAELINFHNIQVDRFEQWRPVSAVQSLQSTPTASYRLEERSGLQQ